MFNEEDVLYAADKLAPYLKTLIPDKMEEVQPLLNEYLERSSTGEKIDDLILDLLNEDLRTRRWMQAALLPDDEAMKSSFQQLPGGQSRIPATQEFECTEYGCRFRWTRRSVGRPVPPCPVHGKKLEPISRT